MDLLEESIIDTRKLKELATEEAKNYYLEKMAPAIKKAVMENLIGKKSVLFEEEEQQNLSIDASTSNPNEPIAVDPIATRALPVSTPENKPSLPSDVPIKPVGGDEDMLNMLMPGPDGTLIVSFDDLYKMASPEEKLPGTLNPDEGAVSSANSQDLQPDLGTPVVTDPSLDVAIPSPSSDDVPIEPAGPPVEPPAQLETYELFSEELDKTAFKINKIYENKFEVPSLIKEALQEKLFKLVEKIDSLKEKNLISKKLHLIFENRLEFLFLKLKEAKLPNTYNQINKDINMSSKARELAQKLLESDTLKAGHNKSPADSFQTEKPLTVNNATEKTADKAGAHAAKETEPTVTLKTEATEMEKLAEEIRNLVFESEGTSMAAKEGEQDLAGAASSIPDKKIGDVDVTKSTSVDKSNEASHVLSVAEKKEMTVSKKALEEQTKKLKQESIKREIKKLQEELSQCGSMKEDGMSMPSMGGGSSAMPMKTENELPGLDVDSSDSGKGATVLSLNFDLGDLTKLIPGLDQLGDEDEITFSDDSSSSSDDDLGGSENSMDLSSSSDSSGLDTGSDFEKEKSEDSLMEGKKNKLNPVIGKLQEENKKLQLQLEQTTNEGKVFTAKVMAMQPYLVDPNLTNKQKHQIVEYLDRGKTKEQVDSISKIIKEELKRVQTNKTNKAGSASKSGALNSDSSLNENKEHLFENASLVEHERNRLMELAGIKRKNVSKKELGK